MTAAAMGALRARGEKEEPRARGVGGMPAIFKGAAGVWGVT
jgi:hypothetical protein